jgi:imidazolonepropionase-like amidohydrolase
VRIGFGTDAGIFPHGENARQFAYMVRHGMTPLAAIRAATIDAAASLGRSQELGSITSGKFADLVAIDGDPLADIERLRHVAGVIKQGQLVTAGASR